MPSGLSSCTITGGVLPTSRACHSPLSRPTQAFPAGELLVDPACLRHILDLVYGLKHSVTPHGVSCSGGKTGITLCHGTAWYLGAAQQAACRDPAGSHRVG